MKLFGFEIKRAKDVDEVIPSFAPPTNDDGAVVVTAGGAYGTYVDLDGTIRTEAELISKYREMALQPEMDRAIEEVINEFITQDDEAETCEIDLDNLKVAPKFRTIIEEEFKTVKRLLEFDTKSYEIARRFYVDGRLNYHVMIEPTNTMYGILGLRYVDPRKIRMVKELVYNKVPGDIMGSEVLSKVANEYFIFNAKGFNTKNNDILSVNNREQTQGLKIHKDSIVYVPSGLTDSAGTMCLSYLHKAIRPLNMLRSIEDATLIYTLSRAPQRRIFYIDIGKLPKMKAEQYVKELMNKYKNKLTFDASTGEIRDDRKFMTMLEDFWIPRPEGSTGTEITTLEGDASFSDMQGPEYFRGKLYEALNVPLSRLNPDNAYSLGRATEITRDEVAFAKFIDRLRLRFSELFLQVLERQLVLKQIIAPEEWPEIKPLIRFKWAKDNLFSELKTSEIMQDRLNRLTMMMPFIGRYFSNEWVRKNVLHQTAEEMEEIDMQIMEELENPLFNMEISQGMGDMMPMGQPMAAPKPQTNK